MGGSHHRKVLFELNEIIQMSVIYTFSGQGTRKSVNVFPFTCRNTWNLGLELGRSKLSDAGEAHCDTTLRTRVLPDWAADWSPHPHENGRKTPRMSRSHTQALPCHQRDPVEERSWCWRLAGRLYGHSREQLICSTWGRPWFTAQTSVPSDMCNRG